MFKNKYLRLVLKLLNKFKFFLNFQRNLKKVVREITESVRIIDNNLNYSVKIRDANIQYYGYTTILVDRGPNHHEKIK